MRMFSDKQKSKKGIDYSKEQNKIARGTVIVGDIQSEGSFRIEGKVKGNMKTAGKIVVSETGAIEGEVICGDADFEGSFTGSLVVKNNLILKATCTIEGEVVTGRLSVEPGASLNGTCTMKGAVKTLKNEPELPAGKKGKIA